MKYFFAPLLALAVTLFVASPVMPASTTSQCPSGQTYTKGYTKANGTKVAGYCSSKGATAAPAAAETAAASAEKAPKTGATSASKAMTSASTSTKDAASATSCPPGKTYVHGYTTKAGTKVEGYCRSKPQSK